MNTEAGFTLVEFLLFLVLGVFLVWLVTLEYRLYRATQTLRLLFSGRSGVDLEQMLRDYHQRMNRSDETMTALNARAAEVERAIPNSVQHVGVVRFNPFPDKGGDQSFAVALLDGHLDGVVFTGLHSRGDSRIYAKPVVGAASTYQLTDEEKEAITRALAKK